MTEITQKQKDIAYKRIMDEIRRCVINEMQQSDGLWYEDRLSPEETRDYRRQAQEIIRATSPDFMVKPRKMASGHTVIPYINIEEDLYNTYFVEGGLNNYFEPGIARLCMSLEFDRSMRFCKEFMTLKKILEIICEIDSEREKYDQDLNSLEYSELYDKYKMSLAMEQMRMDRRINSREYVRNTAFKIIKMDTFQQASAFLKYTDPESPWCVSNEERKYNAFLGESGDNQIYFVLHRDFRDIVKPSDDEVVLCPDIDYSLIDMSDDNVQAPYDFYGFSMMIVHVDENGRLLQCVSRYNHSKGVFSRDFLDEEELSLLLGVNFYETFL